MNPSSRTLVSMFVFTGLLAASQPMLAAASKADTQNAALVAALQAVSPDPLGGQLGLAVTNPVSVEKPGAKIQSTQVTNDQRAYARWKAITKS